MTIKGRGGTQNLGGDQSGKGPFMRTGQTRKEKLGALKACKGKRRNTGDMTGTSCVQRFGSKKKKNKNDKKIVTLGRDNDPLKNEG